MNLSDMNVSDVLTLINRLNALTLTDDIVWISDFPVDLGDPNKESFYFEIGDVAVNLEKNYDPVCMGDMLVLWWYDETLGAERRIPLDYSLPEVATLQGTIKSQVYRLKMQSFNDNVSDLIAIVNEANP